VGAEPARGYSVSWARFDNATRESAPIASAALTKGPRVQAPAGLPSTPGAFIRVQIAAWEPDIPSWAVPVDAYFRRDSSGWVLVGIERLTQEPGSPAGGGGR
jgi:hypothetical protein